MDTSSVKISVCMYLILSEFCFELQLPAGPGLKTTPIPPTPTTPNLGMRLMAFCGAHLFVISQYMK